MQGSGGEVLRTAAGLEGKREGLGERELEREVREKGSEERERKRTRKSAAGWSVDGPAR